MGEGDRKVTLTFSLPWTADVADASESVISFLVRDALYEFYRHGFVSRESAEEYVEKFYDTLTPERKAEKVADVRNRVKLAKGLCLESVKVEMDPPDPCCLACGVTSDHSELVLQRENPNAYLCNACIRKGAHIQQALTVSEGEQSTVPFLDDSDPPEIKPLLTWMRKQ